MLFRSNVLISRASAHNDSNKVLNTNINSLFETHNTNVAIASAITAYSRIHMSQFNNSKKFNLYYSDTDSIYIDKPLSKKFIDDTKLGLLKLLALAPINVKKLSF